jgi:hypothetical protein
MSTAKISNRANAPQAAQFVDTMRVVFGEDVKVLYVREGEVALGEEEARECATCYVTEKNDDNGR